MTDGSHDGFQEVPGIQLYLITMSHLVPPLKQEMLVQLEKLLNSFFSEELVQNLVYETN